MPSTPDRLDEPDYPAGWLTNFRRGMVAGAVVPGLALVTVGVACLVAWLTAGSASGTAGAALRTAGIAVLAGLRGGVVLAGSKITVAPLTVSILLTVILAGPARRLSSVSGFVGMATGFVLACLALSRWARVGTSHTSTLHTAVAATVFVLCIGGALRQAGPLWHRISQRLQHITRAATAVVALYLATGSLAVAVQLARNVGAAVDLQRQLAPGVGGLPIALLGLAVAPNAALAGAGYLAGPGFTLGSQTHVSVAGVSNGPLPVFPLLAAVPEPSAGASMVGVGLLVIVAVAAGLITVAMINRIRGWARLADALIAAGAAGAVLAALGTLGRGDLGTGALRGMGVLGWQTGLAVAALTATSSMLVLLLALLVNAVRPGVPVSAAAPLLTTMLPAVQAAPAEPAESSAGKESAAVAAPAPITGLRSTG